MIAKQLAGEKAAEFIHDGMVIYGYQTEYPDGIAG